MIQTFLIHCQSFTKKHSSCNQTRTAQNLLKPKSGFCVEAARKKEQIQSLPPSSHCAPSSPSWLSLPTIPCFNPKEHSDVTCNPPVLKANRHIGGDRKQGRVDQTRCMEMNTLLALKEKWHCKCQKPTETLKKELRTSVQGQAF